MPNIDPKIIWFDRWIFCRKEEIEKSLSVIEKQMFDQRREGLIAGREIGELNVCRFAKEKCSPEKFKEFSEKFNYDKLDEKYPLNPLLERPNGQVAP